MSSHASQPKQNPKRQRTLPQRPLPQQIPAFQQQAAPVHYPAPEAARPRGRASLWLGLLTLMALAVVGVLAVAAWLFVTSPVILPGTQVLGVALGGLTETEAAQALDGHWQQRQIALENGGLGVTAVSPTDLGITLDSTATARRALEQGRSLDGLIGWATGQNQRAIPIWEINLDVARAKLTEMAPGFEQRAVNAGIQIVNGRVTTTPAIPGQTLDVAASMDWLALNAAQAVVDGRFPLTFQPTQPAVTDVSAAVAEAEQMLGHTVTLTAYDPISDETLSLPITPDLWGGWLQLQVEPGSPQRFRWSLNAGLASTVLAAQAEAWGGGRSLNVDEVVTAVSAAIQNQQPEVGTRLYHDDRTHIVQSGETLSSIGRDYGIPYPWIQQANPGVDALSVGQALTIPSPDVMLPLPVVANKRVVVSISQQRTWVYENGQLKWEWLSSTGIDDSPTAPGIFQVQSHEPNAYAANWDLWMPSFMGIYRPVPTSDFMNGFHGFPTRGGSQLLWTGNLGSKVTYGCILLSSENAAALYDWAEEGVVVEIRP